ncbi:vancomycin high temperature exclusion protein [Streptomyces sp. NPDC056470]|uniref:SanA/YdcF family protein n=1 Tax=Streptomyces sp. NPDC056470 TaxID=3345831 RepID=UPI0036AC8879
MRLPRAARRPHPTLQRLRGLSRPRFPRTRAGQRRAAQAVMLLSVLALLPATWTFTAADDRLRTADSVPRTEVAVVFGAGLRDGEPGSYLVHRLDTAAELYREGRVEVILVTGDNSRHDYDEPHAMSMYLTKRGVPHGRIVSDFAGFDTWDSCVRAKKVFGVDRAVLISQGFHIRRAVALCQAAGVRSYGVGVPGSLNATWYYSGVREIVAAGKAGLDAALQPAPRFLGPREPGVERALSTER